MAVVMLRKTRYHGTQRAEIDVGSTYGGRHPAGLLSVSLGQKGEKAFGYSRLALATLYVTGAGIWGLLMATTDCRRRLADASWRASDHTPEGVGTLKITKVKIRGSIRRGKRIISSTRSWTNLCKPPFCLFMLLFLFLPPPPGRAVN